MLPLSERAAVVTAIERVEQKTAGEIVFCEVPRSDDYTFAPLTLALAGIFVGTGAALVVLGDPLQFVAIQFGGMILGLVAHAMGAGRLVISQRRINEETMQRAMQVFHEQGLAQTRDRAAVLLFVSYLERMAIVLADEGIKGKVDAAAWARVRDKLAEGARRRSAAPIIAAVEEVGSWLASHFPKTAQDRDEKPSVV